jgi:MFS family permease
MYTLLGAFGAIACTFLGDRLGRRKTIFTAAGAVLIGGVLMSTSYSLGQFIVARCILGLGVGGLTATVPVWQSELSRSESRGSHVSSFGIYCGTGLSLALWVSFGMSFTKGSVAWRFPLSFVSVLAIIAMCFIFTLPVRLSTNPKCEPANLPTGIATLAQAQR